MVEKKGTSFDKHSALLDELSVMSFLQLVIPKYLVGENLKTPPVEKVGRSVGGEEVIEEWQKREKENSNSGWI